MRKTERVLPPFADPPDRMLPVRLFDHPNAKERPAAIRVGAGMAYGLKTRVLRRHACRAGVRTRSTPCPRPHFAYNNRLFLAVRRREARRWVWALDPCGRGSCY